jgi:RHS repeat-associated protein
MIRPRCFLGLSFAASWLSLPLFYYLPGNPDKRQNAFDRFGRVTQQLWRDYDASSDADKYGYAYDRNSNRNYRENLLSSGKSELYAYDSLDRLTNFKRGTLNGNKDGITGTPANEEQFTLDAVGNWSAYLTKTSDSTDLDQTRSHNKANEITAIGGTPDWDDPNYDAPGNMTWFDDDGYTYDAWNRMVRVIRQGQWEVSRAEYDGLNRRTWKSVGDEEPVTYDYYYNIAWQLLEVRVGGAAGASEQYVWSLRYIDAPVLRDRDADANAGTGDLGKSASGLEQRVYYLTDGNFNVTALAGTDGSVLERYAYDAYGQPRFYAADWSTRSQSSYANAILFCGYFRDGETGLYHVRHRYYHPRLGRWLSRDPIGYINGNLYQYCCSMPLGALDPFGLSWWSVAWSTINGAVSGAVSGGITGAIAGFCTGGPVAAVAGLGAGLTIGAVAGGTTGLVNGIVAELRSQVYGGPVNTAAIGRDSCIGGLISGGFGALANLLSGPLGAVVANALGGAGAGGVAAAASGGDSDAIAASSVIGGLLGLTGGVAAEAGTLEGSTANWLTSVISELVGHWWFGTEKPCPDQGRR